MTDTMKTFEQVKGYAEIKAELKQLCDIMRNPEVYEKLGVSIPNGLLLTGNPGVGKTLMSQCLISESGWNVEICRKNKPNGEFINFIKECFDKAAQNQPCIVFLDDMDKFANEDQQHDDAEEYVAVQACIDDVKGKKVFVLATVNDEYKLPDSLTRSGRFDRKIEVGVPFGEDAVEIVKSFLSKKSFLEDVDARVVAQLLSGNSCAELETIINDAGVRAGYERRNYISMDDIINAYLKSSYNAGSIPQNNNDERALLASFHEAGHAVMSEILDPGSVTLVSIINSTKAGGMTCRYDEDPSHHTVESIRKEIMIGLAGRAAIEIVFGIVDCGAESDIRKAYDQADVLIADIGSAGLDKVKIRWDDTAEQLAIIERAKISEIDNCYQKVKSLLTGERALLHGIADELRAKSTLTQIDILRIREQFGEEAA